MELKASCSGNRAAGAPCCRCQRGAQALEDLRAVVLPLERRACSPAGKYCVTCAAPPVHIQVQEHVINSLPQPMPRSWAIHTKATGQAGLQPTHRHASTAAQSMPCGMPFSTCPRWSKPAPTFAQAMHLTRAEAPQRAGLGPSLLRGRRSASGCGAAGGARARLARCRT